MHGLQLPSRAAAPAAGAPTAPAARRARFRPARQARVADRLLPLTCLPGQAFVCGAFAERLRSLMLSYARMDPSSARLA